MDWAQLRPLLWYLVSLVLILGLAWWAMGRLGRRGGGAGGLFLRTDRNLRLNILARVQVGRDQYLMVVQAGQRNLLLGVTSGGISLLAELTEEELAAMEQPARPGESGQFAQLLEKLGKKKQDGGDS